MMTLTSTTTNHQLAVEQARLFSAVLQPGWLQCIATDYYSNDSLQQYCTLADSHAPNAFEYMTIQNARVLYHKANNAI